jgi:hypothetical protein
MPTLTLRRRKSRKQRAMSAASTAGAAALTFLKARVAWAFGRRAAKVAVPAVAVGTAAVVAGKRFSRHDSTADVPPSAQTAPPSAPVAAV